MTRFPVAHCRATDSIPYDPEPGMTITDVALYASFSVSLMSFMICREVCVNGREGYGVRNVDRRRKEKKRKEKKKTLSRAKSDSFRSFRVRRSNPARRVAPRSIPRSKRTKRR
jgi:hypothetical protein